MRSLSAISILTKSASNSSILESHQQGLTPDPRSTHSGVGYEYNSSPNADSNYHDSVSIDSRFYASADPPVSSSRWDQPCDTRAPRRYLDNILDSGYYRKSAPKKVGFKIPSIADRIPTLRPSRSSAWGKGFDSSLSDEEGLLQESSVEEGEIPPISLPSLPPPRQSLGIIGCSSLDAQPIPVISTPRQSASAVAGSEVKRNRFDLSQYRLGMT